MMLKVETKVVLVEIFNNIAIKVNIILIIIITIIIIIIIIKVIIIKII